MYADIHKYLYYSKRVIGKLISDLEKKGAVTVESFQNVFFVVVSNYSLTKLPTNATVSPNRLHIVFPMTIKTPTRYTLLLLL